MQLDLTNDRRNDRRAAQRIAQGNQAAFAEFVDRYGPRVQSLARRYTDTQADAEDLTQEIFVDLYRSIGSYRGESALATWVYRVALNHCLKRRERARPTAKSFDDEPFELAADGRDDPARRAAAGELKRTIDQALERLSPEHRDVVILHEMQELTYGECASVLGVPVGTVKSRLYYAFRALRSSLAVYVEDESGLTETSSVTAAPACGVEKIR